MPIYEENRFLTLKGDEIGPDCELPGIIQDFNHAGTGLTLGSYSILDIFGSNASLPDLIAGMIFTVKVPEKCICFDESVMDKICIDTRPDATSEPNDILTAEEIETLAKRTAKLYKTMAGLTATGIVALPYIVKDGASAGESVILASTYLSGALYKALEGNRIYKNVADKTWGVTNWPTPAPPA